MKDLRIYIGDSIEYYGKIISFYDDGDVSKYKWLHEVYEFNRYFSMDNPVILQDYVKISNNKLINILFDIDETTLS